MLQFVTCLLASLLTLLKKMLVAVKKILIKLQTAKLIPVIFKNTELFFYLPMKLCTLKQ